MSLGKRGISPLIATFLLLGLAIGLGILVMNWGRASLEEGARCSVDVGLKIIEVNGLPQICAGGSGENGYITFLLENDVVVDISEIQFRAIGTKGIYVTDLPDSDMAAGYPLQMTIPYSFDLFGSPKQIKFTPKIELFPGKKTSCPKQAIIVEEIRRC